MVLWGPYFELLVLVLIVFLLLVVGDRRLGRVIVLFCELGVSI